MGITTAAKSTFSVGTTAAATNAATFAADTYVEVNHVQDLGEAGSQAEVVTGKFVGGDGYVRKLKGSRDNGSLSLVVARDSADAGQIALLAAEKTEHSYNFKITLNDAPTSGASPKPSTLFFKAIVASARHSLGGADDIVSTTFELAISGAVIEVPASAT